MMKKLAISALVLGLLGVSNVASAACENIYVGKMVKWNGNEYIVNGFSAKTGKATIRTKALIRSNDGDFFYEYFEVKCSSLKEVGN